MGFLLAAISLGFLGSFHCIGMCGPIALALPVHKKSPALRHLLILVYNLGRIITYSFFGFTAGSIGQAVAWAGFQQGLSIGVGAVMLFIVFFPVKNNNPAAGFLLGIKSGFASLFSKSSRSSLFMIGLLNGFLPCGLVYMGIAGAAATGSALAGALFMATFGLGTFPMMLFLPLFSGSISLHTRKNIQKAMPVLITVMALLFILRGLNLGIPYLSPKIQPDTGFAPCHSSTAGSHPHTVIKCAKPSSHLAPSAVTNGALQQRDCGNENQQ